MARITVKSDDAHDATASASASASASPSCADASASASPSGVDRTASVSPSCAEVIASASALRAEMTASASPSSADARELAADSPPSPENSTHTSHRTNGSGTRSLADISAATQLRDPSRYRILGEHGRGGLGRVTRAHDVDLGRDIAIKELISRGPISELRFLREALITARLEHPGIVPVHEAGRWPDGTPFYAMKLVAGRPLRDLIAERRTVDERIGLLHHVIAVADAIAYAHGRNIIHRDLKPSNVIVGDYGETVVIDWGLAKDLTAIEESADGIGAATVASDGGLTSAGTILGTPAYMAPEQARGEPVDQRADVFAIGAMLWELCTLEKLPPAYTGQRRRILRRAGIDQDLATIIAKAIDPDPALRYPEAGTLAADLKAFKIGAHIAARRYSPLGRLAHWTRRHRAAAIAIACATVVAIAAVLFYVHSVNTERERAELARAAAQDSKAAAATALAEKKLADVRAAQAALEQGRAALLHGEPEAQARLMEAYRREPSPSTAFMLARAMQPRLDEEAVFRSTFGRMWSAMFSPDGTQIVTTDDRAAQIWDSRTHQLRATLPHGDEVRSAVYSAGGTVLVTASRQAVRLWDPDRGVLLRELRANRGSAVPNYCYVAISPDRRFVAAINEPGSTVSVWSATTGQWLAELPHHAADWPQLAFSSEGSLAATGGDEVRVFDAKTWTQVLRVPGPVRALAFDRRSRFVIGKTTGDVELWDVPSGARLRYLRQSGAPVYAAAFSPDGSLVAAGSIDGTIQIWRTASGVLQSQVNARHTKIQNVEFDPSSKLLLAAHADGYVVVVDVAVGVAVVVLEGPGNPVRVAHFDPSGRHVVGASLDGSARLWSLGSRYRQWNSDPISDDCGVATTPDAQGRYVAVGCVGRPVRVWDTARDRLLAELPSMTVVESGGFTSAFPVVSAEGDRVAIARGNTVQVYELAAGRLQRTIDHGAAVSAVAFAPVGRDVISGAVDGSVLLSRDDATQRALPNAAGVDAVALLPDGRAVVSDSERHLWVYSPGGVVLANLEMPVRMMSLRRDGGRFVALASYRDTLAAPLVLDLDAYRIIAELQGHIGRVFSARWVAGNRILTAGGDGTARMWDGATGRLLTVYRGGARYLADATLLTEGIVIAGDADGLLRFWDTSNGARLWTLQAHKSAVVGVHIEHGEIITRGFAGDITRWRLPPAEQVIDECRRRPHCADGGE